MHYIITGASGGLGKEVVEYLSAENTVTAIYNSTRPDFNSRVDTIQYDLSSTINIDFSNIMDSRIVLIHLAGLSLSQGFKNASFENLEKEFKINALGGLRIAQSLWPKMRANKYGRIIFVSSVVAHAPVFGTLGYAMSKGALEAATRALLVEGVKDNILPFCIASGYTDCGMIDKVPVEFQLQLKEKIPMHRFGTAAELINAIEFLVDTPYMAGQTIHLNGGLYV